MEGTTVAEIKQLVPSWTEIPDEAIASKVLTGTSNTVMLVETSFDVTPKHVICRVFGSDKVTDKARERKIYQRLAECEVGPHNYGGNATFRVEGYLDGFVPIPKERFFEDAIIAQVVAELKVFHSVDTRDILEGEELICIAHPRKWRASSQAKVAANPGLISAEHWETVQDLLHNDNHWEVYLGMLPADSPVVFAHMDPSPLNFLYNSGQVKFVDFEFAGLAYRAMDIASLLNELPHDYTYEQHPFWKYYPELRATDEIVTQYVKEYGGGRQLWIEVKRALVAINYLWGHWAFAMYEGDREGFDYLSYSLKRFADFKESYEEFQANGGLAFIETRSWHYFPE